MTPLEHRKFELHARTSGYHDRLAQTAEWVEHCFRTFDAPVLNYSGGKDSLVLLHLVAQQCGYDGVDVYHFDNGLLDVPGVNEFVRESVSRIGGELLVRTSNAANDDRMVCEEGHGYRGFWGHHSVLWEQRDWDVRLLGIRAEESNRRRDRFGEPPINWSEEYTAAAPIHQLTTRDVWAYIVSYDLEYHPIYDRQGELYDDHEHRSNRLVTLYDSEFDSQGSREISMFLYPSEVNELKDIEQLDG